MNKNTIYNAVEHYLYGDPTDFVPVHSFLREKNLYTQNVQKPVMINILSKSFDFEHKDERQ